MARAAKVDTPFPSVLETAKRLGVSKHEAIVLSEMAERSAKTGTFILPGIGRLVRVNPKARVSSKNVVKFRVAKAAKDAILPPK